MWLFATPWTVAHQDPLSMKFSRQEHWSWVAISYSRGSSWPRDLTQVSCIAGIFFTNWATGEALESQHAQWLSVMQLVDATPLSSRKLWKLDGITAFLASSTSLVQLNFSLLRVKANASFSQRIRAVALFFFTMQKPGLATAFATSGGKD